MSLLERTLDKAAASLTAPTHVNTSAILGVPDQLIRETSIAERRISPRNSVAADRAERQPTHSQTESGCKYTYTSLQKAGLQMTQLTTDCRSDCTRSQSDEIIRDLGLDNTTTSPPRWYNPPPEKLDPSPRQERVRSAFAPSGKTSSSQ